MPTPDAPAPPPGEKRKAEGRQRLYEAMYELLERAQAAWLEHHATAMRLDPNGKYLRNELGVMAEWIVGQVTDENLFEELRQIAWDARVDFETMSKLQTWSARAWARMAASEIMRGLTVARDAPSEEGLRVHELKSWPDQFAALLDGRKTFEWRQDSGEHFRGFTTGDVLRLREWNPQTGAYTGREVRCRVTYILEGGHRFGMPGGYVIMALGHPDTRQLADFLTDPGESASRAGEPTP